MDTKITSEDLKQIRKSLNLTHDQLAKRLRVSVSTIYHWENKTRNIPSTASVLLEFYAIAIYELIKSGGRLDVYGYALGFSRQDERTLNNVTRRGSRLYLIGDLLKKKSYRNI